MRYKGGTYKIQQGHSVRFIVEIFDRNGSASLPEEAGIMVVYMNTSHTSQTDNVSLFKTGRIFTGIWSSTSSALGEALWSVIIPPSTFQVATGKLKIVQRMGG